MATLENHAASLQDQLIPGLDFRHGNSASYVLQRQNISLYPQSANSFSSSGQRVIRFSINTADWIDPSTVMLYFKVNNKDATAQTSTNITRMQPLGGPHIWISRLKVLCQGQLVEQIDDYNRIYEMMTRLSPVAHQQQQAAQGFGLADPFPQNWANLRDMRRIPPGTGKTVCCPILSGLTSQNRFLPTQYMNLTLEFTVADANDVCRAGQVTNGSVTTNFINSAMDISDVVLKCDSITLDAELQEQYAKKLLSSTLNIPMKCMHHTNYSQTGDSDSVTVTMQRSFSRMCTVFVSFYSVSASPALRKECNYFPHTQGLIDGAVDPGHPLYGTDVTPDNYGIQYEFVIDGKRAPTTPVLTTVEAYANVVRALGLAGQTSHSLGINGRGYESSDCFCIVENWEKVLGAAMSGQNLRGGSQLLLNLKNMAPSGIPQVDKITKIWLGIQYDCILELSAAGGVSVLE